MMRILGAALIGLSAAWMGIALSVQMRRRLQAVTALRDALLLMGQKISFYRLPLPQLLRELAVESSLPVFFAQAADRLEKNRDRTAEAVLCDCLEKADNLCLPPEGQACLRRLFGSLGRLDGQNQAEAVARTVQELDRLEGQLRADLRQKSRCYRAVGICGGLAAAILLV
ncbi:MAG: stage III sporulation protein AB [Oscillospiraceae bacterium]|nr:stage III sporulation protein AB [Oscillospiraceae bacterium]